MDDLKTRIKKVLEKFDIDKKRQLAREIEAESVHPDFWKDQRLASEKMKKLSNFQNEIAKIELLTIYCRIF